MRARHKLIIALVPGAIVAAAMTFPLPRACDARREEVPPERYEELTRFADRRTRSEVEAALRLVDPQRQLAPHYTIDDGVLAVRGGAGVPPVLVKLRSTPAPEPPWRARRIAIDPGHAGGAWSRLEKRHVEGEGGAPVREGDLAWATARLLERGLREAGADVRLLRGPPPVAAYPAGADPGFDLRAEAGFRLEEEDPLDQPWLPPVKAWRLWRDWQRLQHETPFDLYNRYDLRRRAAVAEAFAPDLTLSIHYNFTRSDSNGVLVFMPGNFVDGDLATASQRFWAFREALDGRVAPTLRLASAMGAALMRRLDLPALAAGHDADTDHYWRAVDPEHGVFARNLAILRRTPGIVLLLEGPCVNQTREYQRLQGTEVELDGRHYPQRVREYSEAVLEALRSMPTQQP